MIEVDGFLWFIGAIVVCAAHVLYLRSWRRDQIARQAWWLKYDTAAQKRHVEFMRVMDAAEAQSRTIPLVEAAQRFTSVWVDMGSRDPWDSAVQALALDLVDASKAYAASKEGSP